jgi:TldD protein
VRASLGASNNPRMISREPTIERLATAQRLLLEPFGLTNPT